jgi:hypothetical protein
MEEVDSYEEVQTKENTTYSQAAMDEKFSVLREVMDSKFDKMMQLVQNLAELIEGSTSLSSKRHESAKQVDSISPPLRQFTPLKMQSPFQSRQSMHSRKQEREEYQDANFRHRCQERPTSTMQSDVPSESTAISAVPFYRRRLSGPTNVDPYHRENTIVRSVPDIDPAKSGILLTHLDISHVYKWYKDLIKLQKKHPYDQLHWSSFLSTAMVLRINAFNVGKGYFRRNIMESRELVLENDEIMELLLEITLPSTEQGWIEDFQKLVQFRKLPRNQHEIPPDISRFDDWYIAIMELIWDAVEVYDLLTSIPERNLSPAMKTYSGKIGLMQTFYDCIPQGTGKDIHKQISYLHLDYNLTFEEYTKRFQEQNQKFQDASDAVKHNRAKMNSSDQKSGTNVVNKPFVGNNFNNKTDNISRNHNDKQLVPYHNPYKGKLNNLSENIYDNEYIYDDYEQNDNNYDNNDDIYDIDEVFGGRNDSIEGSNPRVNVTKTLSSIDRTDALLPCFAELQGKCQNSQCKYSHDTKLLQKTWTEKLQELNNSKYRPAISQPLRSNIPLKPLRSITTEEGGQVSKNYDDISNKTPHHNDRNSLVQFTDQELKTSPEPSKGGGDRGQQYL